MLRFSSSSEVFCVETFSHSSRDMMWRKRYWQYTKVVVASFVHLTALCAYIIFFKEVPSSVQPVLSFILCKWLCPMANTFLSHPNAGVKLSSHSPTGKPF